MIKAMARSPAGCWASNKISYYYDDASNAEMNTALISSYEGENQKLDDFVVRCWDLGTMLTITHYGCIFGMSC